jgi:hypothetical protein
MAKVDNKIETGKRFGDFFLKKVPARNQKESKGTSWPCLGQILDTPQTPSGCLRDAFGTAIEKIWYNAKEKSRLFCPEIRFLHPKTRLSIYFLVYLQKNALLYENRTRHQRPAAQIKTTGAVSQQMDSNRHINISNIGILGHIGHIHTPQAMAAD